MKNYTDYTKWNQTNKRLTFHERKVYWKNMPKVVPPLLFSIALGVVLGDGTMYKSKNHNLAQWKFEQSYKHYEYVEHLLEVFKEWSWYIKPSVYIAKRGDLRGSPRSYHFYVFKHEAWMPLWNLMIQDGQKVYKAGTISTYLCSVGLRYWIFDDGSWNCSSQYMTLHTESFTYLEVTQMCLELNQKFGLSTAPLKKSGGYWIIYIPKKDMSFIKSIMIDVPACFVHKIPQLSLQNC